MREIMIMNNEHSHEFKHEYMVRNSKLMQYLFTLGWNYTKIHKSDDYKKCTYRFRYNNQEAFQRAIDFYREMKDENYNKN